MDINLLTEIQKYDDYLHQAFAYKMEKDRRYSFNDMSIVSSLMFLLSQCQAQKYQNYIVNARPILHKFLYSGYGIKDIIPEKSELKQHINETFNTRAKKNVQYKFLDEINQSSYPKSIRKYFEEFLRNAQLSSKKYEPFISLYVSNQRNDKQNRLREYTPRYYLPVYQVLEFVLLFVLYDGRDFSNRSLGEGHRIPKHRQMNQYSEFAYRTALQLNEDISKFDYSADCIYHHFACDQLLCGRKINTIKYYYDLYTSNQFMDRLIARYHITYENISGLKELIVSEIFEYEPFIKTGMKSPYLDFLLVFDILFQAYTVPRINNSEGSTIYTLLNDIQEIRNKCSYILTHPEYNQIAAAFALQENTKQEHKIEDIETWIINQLRNNKFFNEYFFSPNLFLKEYLPSTTELIHPISFSTIQNTLF